jgi:nitroreductase
MDHMHEAPYLLLVCGKRDWPFKVPEEERVGLAPPNYGAVYPCVQNILLACRALGLGAALTTMHQVFEEELHSYFEIPVEWGVVVTIPIGYPLGNFGPVARNPAEDVTYFNTWGTS